jgi:hypothetical protein
MAKDKKAPEPLITVQLGNGHATSAGAGSPGDVVALPEPEALGLIRDGYAVRVIT